VRLRSCRFGLGSRAPRSEQVDLPEEKCKLDLRTPKMASPSSEKHLGLCVLCGFAKNTPLFLGKWHGRLAHVSRAGCPCHVNTYLSFLLFKRDTQNVMRITFFRMTALRQPEAGLKAYYKL
jgi:hypothetical protein